MRQTGRAKSGLFLLELIIAIGLFAISAAVCLQLFAYAHLTVQSASDLNQAAFEARSVAAAYQTTQGDLILVGELFSGVSTDCDVTIWYDADWNYPSTMGAYVLTLTQDGAQATIVVSDAAGTPIYTLETRISEGNGI